VSSASRTRIRAQLTTNLDPSLVDELLNAYEEVKSNYFLGGLRLSGVEGGRFCEAAYRLLQQAAFGTYDPIGRQVDAEAVSRSLANLPQGSHPDSIRLHIPRALRVVYDIRNSRDIAHLADGIDPNLQDATLVASVADWILAELVRINHRVTPNEALRIVDELVTRQAPVIQDFDGFLRVLRTNLSASAHVLVLLYQRGTEGATFAELRTWAKPSMRSNLRRTIGNLVDGRAWVHSAEDRYSITRTGQLEVERHRWLDPI
jgi:hypothetical protein